jgi:hypothetical protein
MKFFKIIIQLGSSIEFYAVIIIGIATIFKN